MQYVKYPALLLDDHDFCGEWIWLKPLKT